MDERIILNTDGKIDLTIPKDFEEYDNTIDIYLHGTDELVGMIWFEDFSDDEFTKYYGNVGYVIKEKFRRKGYAFSALKLLKKVLLDNDIDKMIFSIFPNNIASIWNTSPTNTRSLKVAFSRMFRISLLLTVLHSSINKISHSVSVL